MRRLIASAGLMGLTSSYPMPAVADDPATEETSAMQVQYLEYVTPEVDATCQVFAAQHGIRFSEPAPALGNARTAELSNGGRIGVRAPIGDMEQPAVRAYMLVDDIEAASAAAEAAGAEFAMRATEIPGQGRFAIYFLGGHEFGLWEN